MSGGDFIEDVAHEVFVAVGDRYLFDWLGRCFARPGGLPGVAVAVQAGAAGGYPVAEALAGGVANF